MAKTQICWGENKPKCEKYFKISLSSFLPLEEEVRYLESSTCDRCCSRCSAHYLKMLCDSHVVSNKGMWMGTVHIHCNHICSLATLTWWPANSCRFPEYSETYLGSAKQHWTGEPSGYLQVSWHVCSRLPHRDSSVGARSSKALLLPYIVN